jgi:hypothetical protein
MSEIENHKNATPPCEDLPYSDKTKLMWNTKLVKAIQTRVDVKIDIDKQWFSVWELLFPGAKQPASCRVEGNMKCVTICWTCNNLWRLRARVARVVCNSC